MLDDELNERQKRFCDYYIETLNATESAIRAGYSENTASETGYENLRKPHIKKYIEERMNQKDPERIASQDEVLEYLTSVMRGNIKEECVVVEGCGEGISRASIMEKQVSPKDRNKAAELLGKRYGIFVEKIKADVSEKIMFVDNLKDDDVNGDDED